MSSYFILLYIYDRSMTHQQGCYRCGRSLVFFLGITHTCRGCGKRFCDACVQAYNEEERSTCPGCEAAIDTFTATRRDPPEQAQ